MLTVVIHHPEIFVSGLDRPAHTVIEAARADEICAGIAGKEALAPLLAKPLGRTVRGGIIDDQNVAGRGLGLQLLDAFLKQRQPVIGHDHRGDFSVSHVLSRLDPKLAQQEGRPLSQPMLALGIHHRHLRERDLIRPEPEGIPGSVSTAPCG